jgi:hypothetical protein
VAVQHEGLRAVEDHVPAVVDGNHRHAGAVPAAAGLQMGHGEADLTRGDAGEEIGLLLLRRSTEDQIRAEHHRGQIRGRKQRSPHLLHEQGLLHEREAGAAELLGDPRGLPALAGDLLPERRVVAGFGLHHRSHEGRRCLLVEEAARRVPQHDLLVAQREVHPGPEIDPAKASGNARARM